jgi:hypothetical protein
LIAEGFQPFKKPLLDCEFKKGQIIDFIVKAGITMVIGFILLIIGILLSSWFTTNLQRPVYARPSVFHNPLFVTVGSIIWIGLMLSRVAFIFLSSVAIGVWTIIILAILWAWLRRTGSPERTTEVMLETYRIMRSQYPAETERDILRKVLRTRYQTWDDDKIDSFLPGVANINDVINRVVYDEYSRLRC